MALTVNPSDVLEFLTRKDPNLWLIQRRGTEYTIAEWNESLIGRAQPTEQEVIDARNDLTVVNGQTFTQWLEEHGGDSVKTLRREAKEFFDAQKREAVVQRASDIEIGLYARDAHRNLNALLDGILAANNLADVKAAAAAIAQSPAPADDATFVAGARAAIVARIDAGEGDT